MRVLTQNDIDEWKKVAKEAGRLQAKIINRIDKILSVILETFGHKRGEIYWYFEDAPEGDVGTLIIPNNSEDFIWWMIGNDSPNLCNSFTDYLSGFPVKFLTMTDREIKAFIQDENKRSEEKEQKQKEKSRQNRIKQENIRQQALKKLSAKEKEVLGMRD